VIDPAGTVRWANRGFARLLGTDPAEVVGRHAAELAHPDDIPLGFELLSSARATGTGVKEPVVYRLRHAAGGWVDLECIASVVDAGDGQSAIVLSGRPAAQARPPTAIFDEAAQRVSAMFDRALIGMGQVALDGRILRANDQLAAVLGAARGSDLADRDLHDLLPRALLDDEDGLLTGDGGHHRQVPLRVDREGAVAVWVRLASTLVEDHRGAPLYYAVQAVDVTDLVRARIELEALHEQLLHRAQHDDLTGLANRARLAPWLPLTADRATVLFIDLDGFKAVNDRAGHAAGDAVLVEAARRIRGAVRREDVAARLGGDEFVVLCPYTGPRDAGDLAERLLAELNRPVRHGDVELALGASIGVASGRPGDDFASLIERADGALYEAKAAGRRRVQVA